MPINSFFSELDKIAIILVVLVLIGVHYTVYETDINVCWEIIQFFEEKKLLGIYSLSFPLPFQLTHKPFICRQNRNHLIAWESKRLSAFNRLLFCLQTISMSMSKRPNIENLLSALHLNFLNNTIIIILITFFGKNFFYLQFNLKWDLDYNNLCAICKSTLFVIIV